MWHTYHGRPPIPSRDSTWLSSSRHSPFKTIQEGQYTSDQTKTGQTPKRNKRNSLTELIEPKICVPSRLGNKSSSSTTSKAQAPSSGQLAQWLKHSNVDAPTWSRPPTAESTEGTELTWSPCHDGSSFQDHHVKKGKKQPKDNSFQDHQTSQARSMSSDNEVSYIDNAVSYMDTQSMMYDEQDTCQIPPMPPSCSPPASSPPRHHSPRSPSYSPPASFPSWESSIEPSSEDSSPEGRKRHQSEPAFIQPRDVNQGLTHGLSALLAETSPLAPYRLQWQAKAKAQEKITTHKWLLSRPSETHTVVIIRPPWTQCIDLRGPFYSFKTI